MILLNLFLAILINNFVESRKNYKDDGLRDLLEFSLEGSISQVQRYIKVVKAKAVSIFNREEDVLQKSPTMEIQEEMLKEVELPPGCEGYHKNFDYRLFPVTIGPESTHYNVLKKSDTILTRTRTRIVRLTGRSMFIFSNHNKFRLWLFKWLNHKVFKRGFMYLASLSAFLYMFFDPLSDPKKNGNLALWILNQVSSR